MARAFKRLFDFTGALVGIVLLAPVMALVAVAIRVTIGPPVLFRQVRPGYHARPFTLYKFRTMREATGPNGQPLPDAERLTRLGRFLRKASLDELPQLWNVLKGDMSLVGPRPLLMAYLPFYTEREQLRHQVRPGITGLAQISGRNHLLWSERLELDVKYVENLNVYTDAKILAKTAWNVITRRGVIDVPGSAQPPLHILRGNVPQREMAHRQ